MKAISTESLLQKKNSIKDLTLINTLPAEYFEKYRISGSINVPQVKDDFVERVEAVVMQNKDSEIVVYCANHQCDSSAKAAKKLEAAGFTNVWDYEAGAEGWNEANTETTASLSRCS